MNKVISFVVLFVLLCCVFGLASRNSMLKDRLNSSKADIDTVTVTDTITLYDTIKVNSPAPKANKTIDTVKIYVKDSIFVLLPVTSMVYSDDSTYKVWVSGVNPRLDSINILHKREYIDVIHTVTHNIVSKEWNSYMFLGANQFSHGFSPSIGFAVKSPKRWLFSIETGVYDKNMWGGLKIGYKIR